MKRSAVLLALLAAPLTACKEPPSSPAVTATGFVRPGTDVSIASVREVPANDAVAQSSDEYYVVTFTWTNRLGFALAPRIDHFVLEDATRRRFLGADSGSSALVGIENVTSLLQQGASHEYTVGFRVPQNTIGTLFYDASF